MPLVTRGSGEGGTTNCVQAFRSARGLLSHPSKGFCLKKNIPYLSSIEGRDYVFMTGANNGRRFESGRRFFLLRVGNGFAE